MSKNILQYLRRIPRQSLPVSSMNGHTGDISIFTHCFLPINRYLWAYSILQDLFVVYRMNYAYWLTNGTHGEGVLRR